MIGNKNTYLLFGSICFFIILYIFFRLQPSIRRVCLNGSCLTVELSKTPGERSRGLMFRRQMPLNHGMLFFFPVEDFWGFWMKNTYIPLDIIWLDSGKRIVDMRLNVLPSGHLEPLVFMPRRPARYALEANAGFVERNHVQIGDMVKFQ